jgi:hypothetical protein
MFNFVFMNEQKRGICPIFYSVYVADIRNAFTSNMGATCILFRVGRFIPSMNP